MPNLNIPVDEQLLKAIRVRAAAEDLSRRDWVVRRLIAAVIGEQNTQSTVQCEEQNS